MKTDNILFFDEERSKIKIIDFGVATFAQQDTSRAGSLPYMAPELLVQGSIVPLETMDIWSLGCILFEMLTGSKAFWGTKEQIKAKIRAANIIYPDYLSEEALELLKGIFVLDAGKRLNLSQIIQCKWMKKEKAKRKRQIKFKTHRQEGKIVFRSSRTKKIASFKEEMDRRSVKRTLTFANNDSYDFVNGLRAQEKSVSSTFRLNLLQTNTKVDSSNEFCSGFLHDKRPSHQRPIGFSKEAKKTLACISKIDSTSKLGRSSFKLPRIKLSNESTVNSSRRSTRTKTVSTIRRKVPKTARVSDFKEKVL